MASYYIFTTIDEITWKCSLYIWKQCIFAPTGIMYMNHELFLSAPKRLRAARHPPGHPPNQTLSVGKFRSKEISFSLFLPFSFSVEFGNSFGKVLIFFAGFGSTLFPFSFCFIHSCNDNRTFIVSTEISFVIQARRENLYFTSRWRKLGVFTSLRISLFCFLSATQSLSWRTNLCFPSALTLEWQLSCNLMCFRLRLLVYEEWKVIEARISALSLITSDRKILSKCLRKNVFHFWVLCVVVVVVARPECVHEIDSMRNAPAGNCRSDLNRHKI